MKLRAFAAILPVALLATQAGAQGCVIDTKKPADLRGADQTIGKIQDNNASQTFRNLSAEKPAHFSRTLRLLQSLDKIDNQLGRYYLMGQLYSVWLRSDAKGVTDIAIRGDIGLEGNEKGTHDLYAAIDTVLSKVEAINPACTDSTAFVRYRVFTTPFNKARALMNAGKFDSAEHFAKRAQVVDPKAGAPWNLIAEIRQRKGDQVGYKAALIKVVESTGSDSAAKNVRAQALYNLAVMTTQDGQAATDEATKKQLGQASMGYYNEYLKIKPGEPKARTGLARAMKLTGDSAGAYAIFKEMLVDPTKFTALQLFSAGVDAFGSGLYDDAIAFFEAGLKKNPVSRDGLFNIMNSYSVAEKFDQAFAIYPRLIAVDPSNRANFALMFATFQRLNRSGKASTMPKIADSLIHYSTLRDNSPVFVRFEAFSPPDKGDAELVGIIDNKTEAAKTYNIVVEFLNAAGNPVGAAQTINVEAVPAKTGKGFTVVGKGTGIVSYRYKPPTS